MSGIEKFKLLLGLGLVGYGLFILWPWLTVDFTPVPAVVTQSFKEMRTSSPDRPGRYFYTFEYQYSYQGQAYLSERYRYGGRDNAEAVCNYKTGDQLTAYVNPADPAYAVINRGVSGFVLALIAIGLMIIVEAVLSYFTFNPETDVPPSLKKAHRLLGATIGLTIFCGGLGYFAYLLAFWAITDCVN